MVVRELGGPASLRREELDLVPANPGQVVIDVHAVGCNFFDILITQGKYQVRPELPFSPGAEVAGTVREVGEGVERFSVGDRVSALLEHGGFSSTVASPQERVFPMPPQMTFEEAAALGLVYQTSYVGLVHRANLREGETLLVHAAAGGVGLAAVQIGVALGARVIGTAGTPDKLALVKQNGADVVINYRDEDWVERVKELTDGRGADVIYDPVGGPDPRHRVCERANSIGTDEPRAREELLTGRTALGPLLREESEGASGGTGSPFAPLCSWKDRAPGLGDLSARRGQSRA
jgi:NADPH2:quinone reductase